MRRRLRPALPALSHYFGIRWEHIEDMPDGELRAYLGALEQMNRAR